MSIDLDTWHARGQTYRHERHPIFYVDEGQGEPLLLIHGFPTASWDWHALWPVLTERYRCIAPDMLGFGFSAKPRRHDYRIAEQADLHEGLLDSLGVSRVHVLAHDYGDTVAQELLARDVDRRAAGQATRIASVGMLNGGLFPETHHPRVVQTLLLGRAGWLIARLMSERAFAHNMRAIFGEQTPPSPETLAALWALVRHNHGTRIAHRLIRYMPERREHRARWVGALQSADVPMRLINGLQDPVSGRHMVTRYRELIAAADVVALDCGHYPQIEQPEAVLQAYLAFRAGVGAPDPGMGESPQA
ncbi:MAG: alpha/beta hydrolase [Phycisphaerales bacterium]